MCRLLTKLSRNIQCSIYRLSSTNPVDEKRKLSIKLDSYKSTGDPEQMTKILLPYNKEVLFPIKPTIKFYSCEKDHYYTNHNFINTRQLSKDSYYDGFKIPNVINDSYRIGMVLEQWGFQYVPNGCYYDSYKKGDHWIWLTKNESLWRKTTNHIKSINYENSEIVIEIKDIYHLPIILEEINLLNNQC